jgi:predicted P-loop ATPase
VRLAYDRLPTTVPRQFVLIGTTNLTLGYIKDHTGGRRFWPVRLGRFDVEAVVKERDQLWAEATAREADSESIRLRPELWSAAGAEQQERRAVDPWEDSLERLLEGDGITRPRIVAVEAIWEALKLEANHRDNRHADRVSAILQRRGFTKGDRIRIEGIPTRCWVREEPEP